MINGKHCCVRIEGRLSDFFQGDGHIGFKANLASGDWTPYFHFNERQKYAWDDDGCVCFAAQKIFDAQVDCLVATGQIAASAVSNFTALGFMDSNSDDGKPHFHSSARFLQGMTGNGFNGNPLPAPWDVMRKCGALPWADLPFDANTTQAEYLSIPAPLLLKAKGAIPLLSVSYQWIEDSGAATGTPITKMKAALQQSPLQIGINVCGSWNQANPVPCADLSPQHSDAVMAMDTVTHIHDDYEPFDKSLPFSWNIGYCLQAVVSPVPQAPAPLETLQPVSTPVTPGEKMSLIQQLGVIAQQLKNWLYENFNSKQ